MQFVSLCFIFLFKFKKLLSEKLRDLRDTIPRPWLLCFLLSPCYLQDTMPCQWSSSDFLPRVLRIWEGVFYFQAFFTLHSFLLVLRPPWGRQFSLNNSRASCWYFRNIVLARLFIWITTIHNKKIQVTFMYGLPLARYEYNVSYEIWTLFTIVCCVRGLIIYPFGHRA